MIETEINIINSAIMDDNNLIKLMMLSPDYFTNDMTRLSMEIMKDCYQNGQKVGYACLLADMQARKVDNDKANNFITMLVKTPHVSNFDYLLNILQKEKNKKDLMLSSVDLYKALKAGDIQHEDFIDKIIEIKDRQLTGKDDNYFELNNFSDDEIEDIFKRSRFIRTGLPSLDEKISGLWRGQTNIIAGRPGSGKSTLGIQIAQKYNTLFFSLEMTRHEIYAKILCSHSEVESWKIESKRFTEEEGARIKFQHKDICNKLKMIVFDKNVTYASLINYANVFIKLKQPELMVIDYIQLVPGASGENQNLRISETSRALKLLAMNHNIPLLILSQLNREIEKSKREPVLADLRDSGALEQDASFVIFLHPVDEDKMNIIVAKNRKGRTGKIEDKIYFDKQYSRFNDIESGKEIQTKMGWIND